NRAGIVGANQNYPFYPHLRFVGHRTCVQDRSFATRATPTSTKAPISIPSSTPNDLSTPCSPRMNLTDLAQRIDIAIVNVSVLKDGRACAERLYPGAQCHPRLQAWWPADATG
ncbi:MAG: hypothetical protein QOH48_354, partial [Actinomycetota bacterium]|nr:hypothetical protein [Actinomycetota bacterium]